MTALRTFRRWQDVGRADLRGDVVAVIDVLRWSTVVCTALAGGAECVEAWGTPEEALRRAAELGRERVLLGGERGNLALPGFDVGNSPAEYTAARVAGRTVITTTTNGTQALLAAREAREVVIGAFVNLSAVTAHLRAARAAGARVTLLCAGQAGAEALEDAACAGAIAEVLTGAPATSGGGRDAHRPPVEETTTAAIARWRAAGGAPLAALTSAPHAAALRAAGFTADLLAAAMTDAHPVVPVATGRVIRARVAPRTAHESG